MFFFKQKTAYEMRISDWSSDVCSSDLYRNEWIRFTNTIGRPGEGAAPFYERVVKAIADITESPAGVLLLPGESGALSVQARWNWRDADIPAVAMNARHMVALEERDRKSTRLNYSH